ALALLPRFLLLRLGVVAVLLRTGLPVLAGRLLPHRRQQVVQRIFDFGRQARIAGVGALLLAGRIAGLVPRRLIAALRIRRALCGIGRLILLLALRFALPAFGCLGLVLRIGLLIGDPLVDFRHIHRVQRAIGRRVEELLPLHVLAVFVLRLGAGHAVD